MNEAPSPDGASSFILNLPAARRALSHPKRLWFPLFTPYIFYLSKQTIVCYLTDARVRDMPSPRCHRTMSPKTPPGETREKIYTFMRDRLLAGMPPTVREVQHMFGFKAVQTAQAHLEQLVAMGRLIQHKGRARGYALPESSVDYAPPPVFAPLLGQIQAGDLQAAIEDREGTIPVQSRATRRGSEQLFALRVRGESMTGAGILPDDIVIVRIQETANPGDIVVALVGDEATVKTFRTRRGRIVLMPENPDFAPIVPDPEECRVLGKVIEVRRYIR